MHPMKLINLLPNHEVHIEFRTHGPNSEDMLYGFCHWDGNELESLDGDNYSVNDIIESYEWDGNKNLIVWYESKWI